MGLFNVFKYNAKEKALLHEYTQMISLSGVTFAEAKKTAGDMLDQAIEDSKKEGTYYQSDLQGTWNFHGLFSANNFSSNTHDIHSSTILADQEFDFSEGQIVDSDGDMVYRSYAWGTTTSSTFTEGEVSGNYGNDFSDFLGFLDSQNFLPDAGAWHDYETVYLNDGSFDARWKWTRWVKTTEGRYAIVFVADAETDFLTFIWFYPYGTFAY